jgi:hypothetical protein
VRQAEIFLNADMGEIESARMLLGALLESGKIADEAERAFLFGKLRELESSVRTAAHSRASASSSNPKTTMPSDDRVFPSPGMSR